MATATDRLEAPHERRSRGLSERRLALFMVSPSMALIALVAAYPIFYAIWLSLHEYASDRPGSSRWAEPLGLRQLHRGALGPGLLGRDADDVRLHGV